MKLSLAKQFTGMLAIFVIITVFVLVLLMQAHGANIGFAKQEMLGNSYQRPVEKVLQEVMAHRIYAQRALYGEKSSLEKLSGIQQSVDAALKEMASAETTIREDLQFTPEGLEKRQRQAASAHAIMEKWNSLKGEVSGLKPDESNTKHQEIIGALRMAIAQLGDTSNLILDPDLDSYYLMDITLLALPQTQDRIQSAVIEFEPVIRRKTVTIEEQIRASVVAALMRESDSERLKADFQTVLNEDPNFYGKLDTLVNQMQPIHDKFIKEHYAMIEMLDQVAKGTPPSVEAFNAQSETALKTSFEYWREAVFELDKLLETRINSFKERQLFESLIAALGLLGACLFAGYFLNRMIGRLRSFIGTLSSSSQQIADNSAMSADSATRLSEASTEQAASLQETMASVEEISAMVSQNAESANKTKEAVDANQVVAQQGSQSVAEMMTAIEEIRETNDEILSQMEVSNKQFAEIVGIISSIGQKTTVINEIVFQTKLLSFNASVEAARAGEHGKGFAVVAEEVGNLAQMSGNAAKEITEMLTDSIKKVNEIVEQTKTRVDRLVETGKDKIIMGQSTAQKCKEALDQITANAQGVAGMVAEINHASKEQAQGVQEINKAISQLDKVTQQNSSVAQQSSDQAESLSTESTSLAHTVRDLVSFIEGGAGEGSQVRSSSHSNTSRQSGPGHHSAIKSPKPSTPTNVLPMEGKKKKKSAPPAAPEHKPEKVAVGAADHPSHDSSEFKDF